MHMYLVFVIFAFASIFSFFFFQAEDGIRDKLVTGVQTCALPISPPTSRSGSTSSTSSRDWCAPRPSRSISWWPPSRSPSTPGISSGSAEAPARTPRRHRALHARGRRRAPCPRPSVGALSVPLRHDGIAPFLALRRHGDHAEEARASRAYRLLLRPAHARYGRPVRADREADAARDGRVPRPRHQSRP